ncbi:hypothetical protein KC332_g3034 [Hortaea werneckii]|nr:hypothetical protein KC358_g12698 [Hortaea werneckii]KAI6849610.1 hypothetical protein KC350_g2501 [Hortaea werneckii]KAI6939556.1 hypothetical protein KC341_g4070 [Hortaea werneckii]KAI6942369.1 hypothetical protein KC348_g4446 [Hortaea werneckii]KAI6975044.1 hypothetical protein KC321_g4777 [Hortaea werneckii]
MCKIWNIKYGCDHIFSFRLSTCRGSVTAQAKSGDTPTKVLCHPSPALSFYDNSQPCGPCQRRPEEEMLAQWMDAVKSDGDENIYEVQAEYDKQLYRLNRRLPDGQKKRCIRPPQQTTTQTNRGSLLKFEVMPEDIPEDEYAEYYRQWALPSSTITEGHNWGAEETQQVFDSSLEGIQGFVDSGSDFDSTAWSDQNDRAEQQTCKTSSDCSAQIRLAKEQNCWMTAWPSVGAW